MSILTIDDARARALVLGPGLAGTLMSADEFDNVDDADENWTYELVHGVLIVVPPPLEEERGPNEELALMLRLYKMQHPQGSALDETLSEQHVRTSANRRRADRVIWAGLGRTPNPKIDMPAIVIEFVSEGKRNRQRDYIEKRNDYLTSEVREYWIIDRFARTMTACRCDQPDVTVAAGEIYRTPLLPGFELPLARLFEVADRWSASKEA
jgi:Uma2 family endonuclease